MSTTEIPLTQGKVAFVDECDMDLARFEWSTARRRRMFYAQRNVKGVNGKGTIELLHRAIWKRAHPGEEMPAQLDHWDGDGLNCRRGNLRPATHTQNQHNERIRCNNTSGFKGVYWFKRTRCWRAQIGVTIEGDRTNRWLGDFDTREDAARAYDQAARSLFGTFACVNFPLPGERPAR